MRIWLSTDDAAPGSPKADRLRGGSRSGSAEEGQLKESLLQLTMISRDIRCLVDEFVAGLGQMDRSMWPLPLQPFSL